MSYKEKFNMPEAVVVLRRLKIIACKKCPKAFTKKKEYKLHKLRHDLVNMQKQRKEERRKIYQININGFEKRIQCEECDLKFVEKSTLDAHSALHKPFPHICKCGIGFYAREDLKCHKKIVHEDVEQREPKKKVKEPKNMILIGSKKTKKLLNSCETEI